MNLFGAVTKRRLVIGKRIGYLLKIEMDTAPFQPCPFTAPLAEQVAVPAPACLMAVRAAESLFWLLPLQILRRCQRAKAGTSQKSDLQHSCVHGEAPAQEFEEPLNSALSL